MNALLDITFAVFPTAGYWAQLYSMRTTRNADGFSPLVSLILLLANILRIVFWVVKRFDSVLLWQSLIMMAMQFGMIYEICHIKTKYTIDIPTVHAFLDRHAVNTLRGTAKSVGLIFVGSLFLSGLIGGEAIGLLSVLIECTLVVPQIMRNHARRTTEGLSSVLVLTWAFGDAYKFVFCFERNYPIQFIMCAAVQLLLDAVVAYQLRVLPSAPTTTTTPPQEMTEVA